MSKIAAYRAAMLARKAAAAGITVEELIRRSEMETELTRRVTELRFIDHTSGWQSIARKAAAHGRIWEVL